MKKLLSIIMALAMVSGLFVMPVSAASDTLTPFADGDRVMFLGDSITHYGMHLQYIEQAYTARYPERDIKFINDGISGDSLGYALTRIESDIDEWQPTEIVVMYGMNDLKYSSYYGANASTVQNVEAKRAEALEAFKTNAQSLVNKIKSKDSSIDIIWLTPTPFDDDCTSDNTNYDGYGKALEDASEWLKTTFAAANASVPVIDLNGPMTAMNAEYQKTDSERTIIGSDRIHPQALGSQIMTMLLLDAQGFEANVAEAVINASALTTTTPVVSNIKKANDKLSYTYKPASKPFPEDNFYDIASELSGNDFNNETVKITGLEKGVYTLTAGGKELGRYSDAALARGVDISGSVNNGANGSITRLKTLISEKAAFEAKLRNYAFCKKNAGSNQTIKEYYDANIGTANSFSATRLNDALYIYENGDAGIKADIDAKNAEIAAERANLPSYTMTLKKAGYSGAGTLVFSEDFEGFNPGTYTSLTGYTLTANHAGTYTIEENDEGRYFHISKAATDADKMPGLSTYITPRTGKFVVEYDAMVSGSRNGVVFRLLGRTATDFSGTAALGITLNASGTLSAFNNPESSSSGVVKSGLAKNQFHHIKLEINVDENTFKIWVNGEACLDPLSKTYDWSFRQCTGANKRVSLTYFDFVTSNTKDGDVAGAIDNLFMYDTTSVEEEYDVLIDEDFEEAEINTVPSGWSIVSTIDSARFKTVYSDETELNKVMEITPDLDTVYFIEKAIGDRTDTLILDFDYKQSKSTTRPVGVYFDGNIPNVVSIFNLYGRINNLLSVNGTNWDHALKTDVEGGIWHHMKVIFDVDDQSMTLWLDGEYLGISPFRNAPNVTKLSTFKIGPTGGTSKDPVQIDNITLLGTKKKGAIPSTSPIDTYDFNGDLGTLPEGFKKATGEPAIAYKDGVSGATDRVLRMVSSDTTENQAMFSFDELKSGIVNFEFDYKLSQGKCPMTRFYLNGGNTFAISLALTPSRIISMGDAAGNPQLNTTVGTGEGWHHILLSINIAANSYTVTIDETEIPGTYYFRNKLTGLNSGYFGTAKHGTTNEPDQVTTQIDNFVIGNDSSNTGSLSLRVQSPGKVDYEKNEISGADFNGTVESFLGTLSCINADITLRDADGNPKTTGNLDTEDVVVVTGTRAGTVREFTLLPPYDIDVHSIIVEGDEYVDVDYIDKSGKAKIKFNLFNNTPEAIKPAVIAATYAGDKMVSVDMAEITSELAANTSAFFDAEVNIPDLSTDGTLKILLLDSMGTLTPLITAKKRIVKTDEIYALPNIFGNGMVLQRNKDANIFGTAPTGTKITVEFDGDTVTGYASGNRFNIQLPVGEASAEGKSLTVTMENDGEVKLSKTFTDVVVGDVYFGSGQSNMQWTLSNSGRPVTDIPDNFRYFSVSTANDTNKRVTAPQTLNESWKTVTSSNYNSVGAIAFYTAQSLRNIGDIDVPIGFINCSMGGTSINTWIGMDLLYGNDAYTIYRSNFEKRITDNHGMGCTDLYYNMTRSVLPYTVSGALWYQGESDISRTNYDEMLKYYIEHHRALWGDDVPFFIMQLPGYGVTPNWDRFRLIQWNIGEITDNTYVIVNNDTGEEDDIHPKDKDIVSERIARRMLKEIYGKNLPYSGPVYKSASVSGNNVTVSFDYVNDGIHGGLCSLADDNSITTFELSADGSTWYGATAQISGNEIVLTSANVAAPAYVRFGYVNTPVKSLGTDSDGVKLPLAPFSEAIN